jgi:hypothetical protein
MRYEVVIYRIHYDVLAAQLAYMRSSLTEYVRGWRAAYEIRYTPR